MPRTSSDVTTSVRLQLEDLINSLPVHSRIPPRRSLMQSYGVSRTTIDRAIAELTADGVLYARGGSGTYVAERRIEAHSGKQGLTIGVLLPDIRRYNYPAILRGIEHAAFERGVNLMVGNIENQATRQNHYLKSFVSSGVSGVIIIPARPNPSEQLEEQLYAMLHDVTANNIPCVFCNRAPLGFEAPQVICNDFLGGLLGTQHLLEQGYRRIAYISHPRYTISLNRYMGYLSAHTLAGIVPDPALTVFSESWDFEKPGRQELARLISLQQPPDAAFCFTDFLALGAYRTAVEHGLTPGSDFGIMGYDDNAICKTVDIPLSSVKVHSFEMGSMAAKVLFESIARPRTFKPSTDILAPELAIRASSRRVLKP
ncbi:GntR family transcriptional regulator [Oleidesulfovibrio sp.]|uniref:GntR family transcriptional regulator n=1 Tax=Oleidesulfovibrio sp. TaxID=2909707 RepID=UPI003A86EE5F